MLCARHKKSAHAIERWANRPFLANIPAPSIAIPIDILQRKNGGYSTGGLARRLEHGRKPEGAGKCSSKHADEGADGLRFDPAARTSYQLSPQALEGSLVGAIITPPRQRIW